MRRRALLALVVLALVAAGPAFAGCPLCAGSGSPRDVNIWPVVGAFICVPWLLALGAFFLLRREFRTTFGTRRAGEAPGQLLRFSTGRPGPGLAG